MGNRLIFKIFISKKNQARCSPGCYKFNVNDSYLDYEETESTTDIKNLAVVFCVFTNKYVHIWFRNQLWNENDSLSWKKLKSKILL